MPSYFAYSKIAGLRLPGDYQPRSFLASLAAAEDEIPSSEGVSDEGGTAPWLGANLEHKYNKVHIKELEL